MDPVTTRVLARYVDATRGRSDKSEVPVLHRPSGRVVWVLEETAKKNPDEYDKLPKNRLKPKLPGPAGPPKPPRPEHPRKSVTPLPAPVPYPRPPHIPHVPPVSKPQKPLTPPGPPRPPHAPNPKRHVLIPGKVASQVLQRYLASTQEHGT
jgi:hypothetical protein